MEGETYQVEEKQMLQFSESPQAHQISHGETKVGRKRKKVKGEEAAGGLQKRRLSAEQVRFLEMNFGSEHKLEAARKDRLAIELGLEPRQVAVWFQNRRVRWKCKQMEEEYMKLKKKHESVLLEKCQLEDEVLKLREEISAAETEVRRLSERYDEATSEGEKSCSPSSSLSSMKATHPSLGDSGDNLFYAPDCTYYYYVNDMDEWTQLYTP